jgi:L-cystine uptake protein TcyP (sodium:dicarboxylate symporter family)
MNGTQATPEYGMVLANCALLILWIVAVVGARRKWRTFLTVLGALIVGTLVGSMLGLLIFHNSDVFTSVFGWVAGFGQALFEINANVRARRLRQQREADHS